MCFVERCTHRRGRSDVPANVRRMRTWIRRRCASRDNLRTGAATRVLLPNPSESLNLSRRFGSGLSCLLLQSLAGNSHALLLVGIGWTQGAKICRYLTDLVFI